MEMNEAHNAGRAINWTAIKKDNPRLNDSPWYVKGRETPPIGKKKIGKILRMKLIYGDLPRHRR